MLIIISFAPNQQCGSSTTQFLTNNFLITSEKQIHVSGSPLDIFLLKREQQRELRKKIPNLAHRYNIIDTDTPSKLSTMMR